MDCFLWCSVKQDHHYTGEPAMICLFLFVIRAMFSDCRFEQMDRGRKGQEKYGEENEMKGYDILFDMVPCFECSIDV